MPRARASRVQSGGGSSALTTCPPSKFSFLSGCTSWTTVLATIALLAVLTVALLVTLNRQGMLTSGRAVMMIENDLSVRQQPNMNRPPASSGGARSSGARSGSNNSDITFSREGERYTPNDTTDDRHNGTGTPTSERISYPPPNPIIRDVISYSQNPNVISYGRYEAEKNIERIINPLLPPERGYVNTYGIPINIPSRGPFQAYQQVGILSKEEIADPHKIPGNNTDSNVLPLFGRPTYSGSNRWNYYTSSDKFQSVKLPINIDNRKCTDDLGCDELRDGDMVTIPSYNGRFKVEIYDFDKPRYIPFVY